MDAKFQHNPKWDGPFTWPSALFLISTPLLTLAMLPSMVVHFSLTDFAIFSFMIFTTGIALTVGYHRLFAHQTFETPAFVRGLLLFFGAGCIENSALRWSSDHRYHHRFVDKEGDPYNINRGFFFAHMGWIFFSDPPGRTMDNATDLSNDPLVRFQDKHYGWLSVFVAFVLPTLLGLAVGRPLAGFFWGGLFRVVFLQHMTFFINSACHVFGSRPYSTKHSARDSWWLAFLTNGEGYHNFHHTFGTDYRNGVRWFQWDPSKWFIATLAFFGLAYNLKRTPDAVILKARLETAYEEFRAKLAHREVPSHLVTARAALDTKLQEFQVRLREFQAWKETKTVEHRRARRAMARLWKLRMRHERRLIEEALAEFRIAMRLAIAG